MNSHELEQQARLQAQAEQAERQHLPAGGDPAIDRYRLVLRALRQPLALQLPGDFAARVSARMVLPEESNSLEDWLTTLLMLAMAMAGLFYVQPVMASVLSQLHLRLPGVPWPLLGAAALSVAVAWALDRGATSWRRGADST